MNIDQLRRRSASALLVAAAICISGRSEARLPSSIPYPDRVFEGGSRYIAVSGEILLYQAGAWRSLGRNLDSSHPRQAEPGDILPTDMARDVSERIEAEADAVIDELSSHSIASISGLRRLRVNDVTSPEEIDNVVEFAFRVYVREVSEYLPALPQNMVAANSIILASVSRRSRPNFDWLSAPHISLDVVERSHLPNHLLNNLGDYARTLIRRIGPNGTRSR